MQPVRKLQCPVDFSPLSEATARLAATLAARFGAQLVLQHNLASAPPNFLTVRWMWSEEHRAQESARDREVPERLQELLAELPADVAPEARLTRGPLGQAVVEVAQRLPADLLVMGSHGWSSPEHRSLAEQVVLSVPCPVITISDRCDVATLFAPRPGRRPEDLAFVVPVDFSAESLGVLAYATELARWMPHRIHLVHVLAPATGDDPRVHVAAVAERSARLDRLLPAELQQRASTEVRTGEPAREILQAAEEAAALFVLMPARRSGLVHRQLFGDTTARILHESPWPVWFVPEAVARELAAS
jgi:nucleotide-binding universal stress UspA family protein